MFRQNFQKMTYRVTYMTISMTPSCLHCGRQYCGQYTLGTLRDKIDDDVFSLDRLRHDRRYKAN